MFNVGNSEGSSILIPLNNVNMFPCLTKYHTMKSYPVA